MQNVRPTNLAPATEHVPPVSGTVNRVIAVAPAPLLPGEKQADYANVVAGIVKAAQPRDAIEEFLVRDVVDLTWEILRLRSVKAGIVRTSMRSGVQGVLARLGHKSPERDKLANSWIAGNGAARTKVDVILSNAPRRAGTTHCEKSIVTATRLAAACVDQSKRSRTRSSETSRLARLPQGRNLDHRPPTVRQSR
jgi:hypothetical protein